MKNKAPVLKGKNAKKGRETSKPSASFSRQREKRPEPPGAAVRRLKYVLAILMIIVVGLGMEYFWNVPVLFRENRGVAQISLDQAASEGFTRTDEGLLLTEDTGTISIGLGGAYVDRFVYHFQYDHLLNAKIYVCYYNEYGEADPDQDLLIEDRNNKITQSSSLNIGKRVDSLVISLDKSQLGETGTGRRQRRNRYTLPVSKCGMCRHSTGTGWDFSG